ncbi:substrate-binding domain-containing protein [Phytohabitans rumicis]|uniref:ABC transporter substrate-binding protein n=1 Tax=Phytohabitans rumicis TaxID=1076125 RepID=A0A6V8LEF2_9ACTN|nr:substrate-binding domain-containing protein [Phytohabitans rumicis]GFJ95603.1 ABC transporter substrate-binding protein [Phytohabitans rumicis]
MRVRTGLILLLATCASAAAGCGGDGTPPAESTTRPRNSSPITLAVVPKALGFDFWRQVRLGAECAASKHEQVTVRWDGVTAETDVVGQVNLLQRFIGQDVDGIVYAATDAAALAPITDQALANRKVVVNIDSGTYPQPSGVPLFATDNVAAATRAADLLAQALGPGEKKIAFFLYEPGSATNDQRAQGFKAGLARHPRIRIVAEQSTQSDFTTAVSVTERILATTPDLDGIFAANEPTALGAAEAVQKSGKAGRVTLVGWDAAPQGVKLMQDGVITSLVAQNPFRMGYDGVNAAVKMIREGGTVSSADTGVSYLSAQNLTSPRHQALLRPSCANPPV